MKICSKCVRLHENNKILSVHRITAEKAEMKYFILDQWINKNMILNMKYRIALFS